MPQFRSKGKGANRRVFPIRKPYGETKSRATQQVDALREKGERARRIETNRRLQLYAPYESALPEFEKDGPQQLATGKKASVPPISVSHKRKLEKAKTLGKPVDVVLGASGRANGYGNSVYIAKINGTDPKYRFQREFLNAQTFRAGKDVDKVYRGKLPPGTIIETHEGENKFLGIVDAHGKVTNWQNEDSIEVQKKYDRILRQREKYGINSE